MKIDKAIKELTRYRKEPYSNLHPYFSEAVDLSIEALKAVTLSRKQQGPFYIADLPGETEKPM